MTPSGPTIVYLLCLVTSATCAALLLRSWLRNRQRLLMWSAGCFCLLALNNLLVVIDMTMLTASDLSVARTLTAFAAVSVLIYGFIWEADR
ncbi:DUF5985 family protein [Brevundimonas sp.]|uniref:DUF5985 family protein n=1 Tax=Brevundimonas sp. TaxID=1871086 RepID=UPI0035AEBB8A